MTKSRSSEEQIIAGHHGNGAELHAFWPSPSCRPQSGRRAIPAVRRFHNLCAGHYGRANSPVPPGLPGR
jgi:hypothetical protein